MRAGMALRVLLAAGCLLGLSLGSACNAVFGLDDVTFGSGGAGGEGATSTGAPASSSSSGPDLCEESDLVLGGELDDGWEAFWSNSGVTVAVEEQDGDPALHVIVDELYGSVTNELGNGDLCAGGCITARFGLRALNGFTLDLGVSDYESGLNIGLVAGEGFEQSATFETVSTSPCRIPATFTGPDALAFAPSVGADLFLDDVELIVDDCPGVVDECGFY